MNINLLTKSQKEVIDPQILEQVANALHVNPEAIKNFNEEQAINIFSNTFSDFKDNAIASAMNYQCTFNPIDKIVQLYDEKIIWADVKGEEWNAGKAGRWKEKVNISYSILIVFDKTTESRWFSICKNTSLLYIWLKPI